MNYNLKDILLHRYTYKYLSFVCVILIIIFTIQHSHKLEFISTNLVFLIISLSICIGMIVVVYQIIKNRSKEEYLLQIEQCEACAKDSSKYQFANFDFLTFDELISIEESLKSDIHPEQCYVYIYTSDISTEDDAEKTVIENIKSHVNYKVFYIDGIPTEKQISLYKKENLYKCEASQIDRSADFDIMIYIDSNQNISGYFCVNFSKTRGPRPCSQGFKCTNECHYQNENLLYKRIREDSVQLLLSVLKERESIDEK